MRINRGLKKSLIVVLVAIFIVAPILAVAPVGVETANAGLWDFFTCGVGSLIGGGGCASGDAIVAAGSGILADTVLAVMNLFVNGLRYLMSYLLRIAGGVLDSAIQFSVNTENFTGENSALNASINAGWTILRDLINMMFIFIVLYIAIKMMLGISGGSEKKALSGLVIAALLINFSKFIAGVVIDIGNLLALGFYKALGSGELSLKLIDGLELLQTFADTPGSTGFAEFVINCTILILFTVTTVTFFFAALLFVVRIVSIVVLLMTSPIGFAGMVLPEFKQYANKWWKELINQSMIAAVFLFFIYALMKLINNLILNIPESGDGQQIAIFLNFAIIIYFIILSVKTAKNMSGEIGGLAVKAAGIAGGLALGGAALLGTKTVGRAGSALMTRYGEKWADKAESGNFAERMGARAAMFGSIKAKKSTFDVRKTKVGGYALGEVSKYTGIKTDSFKTPKDGFQGTIDRKAKRQEEYQKEIGAKTLNKEITVERRGASEEETKAQADATRFKEMHPKQVVEYGGQQMTAAEAQRKATLGTLKYRQVAYERYSNMDPNQSVVFEGQNMKASEASQKLKEYRQTQTTIKAARAERSGGIVGNFIGRNFGSGAKSIVAAGSVGAQVREKRQDSVKDDTAINVDLKTQRRLKEKLSRELARLDAQLATPGLSGPEKADLEKKIVKKEGEIQEAADRIDDLEDKKARKIRDEGKDSGKKDDKKDSGGGGSATPKP